MIWIFFIFSSLQGAVTSQKLPYYGDQFYSELKDGRLRGSLLKDRLFLILSKPHKASFHEKGDEIIMDDYCYGKGCYQHVPIKYWQVKTFLMGEFYLVYEHGQYGVKDVYCNFVRVESEFPSDRKPAPGKIPDTQIMNIEHTWPQSLFSKEFSQELQKVDLHHLYPTDSEINLKRGNRSFGKVHNSLVTLKCPESKLGLDQNQKNIVFEPPDNHKGNVARAIFYFATRYRTLVHYNQESILRSWHEQDPPDQEEILRNQKIFHLQKNRNPYIDHPELVSQIDDF